jgi:hypothetical protein
MIFTTQKMQEILSILKASLEKEQTFNFYIFNPDLAEGYAGTHIVYNKKAYLYRGYKSWVDLAELLGCKMLTPIVEAEPLVKLTFARLEKDSFHNTSKDKEKYGISSAFAQIYKMEEPAFLYYYQQALENISISQKTRVLNLGVNRGDEFEVIKNMLSSSVYENINFVGIDHSQTAINYAQNHFNTSNMYFFAHDINDLDSLNLAKFDVLISIGTLQSPSIAFKPFFMKLVQEYLSKDSAIILGFPNSRWRGGEMLYGAKAPHYAMSEMGLLLSDIMFCKKYLQQKKYRVTITGKTYLFLTATKIGI